ncbi:MAG: polyisoprenoid-binding protein [Deltaproteobacteria bacterium]|nr:MAG: polyisoprenoid-binding protein [Deltaproteobacteria bacterium]
MRRRMMAVLFFIALFAFAPAVMAAETYAIDPVHSTVIFRVKHLGVGYLYGRFNDISGTIRFDEANPAKSSVEVTVKVASVDTNDEKRDKHLLSPDFFNAKQFPVIRFESASVKAVGGDLYEVSGNMTIHGITKPITVKMTRIGAGKDPWGNYRMGFEGVFSVKRSDFGIRYMPQGIGDDVLITLSVEAIRK